MYPVAAMMMEYWAKTSTSVGEGEVRSSCKSEVVGERRGVCFEGVRVPIVMEVLGREEMEGRRARPSSPAPRRRMFVCSAGAVAADIVAVLFEVVIGQLK